MLGKWILLPVLGAAMAIGADEPWKSKRPTEWTPEDAKAVLTASPWARGVTPHVGKSPVGNSRSGMYSRGGVYGGLGNPSKSPETPAPPLTVRWNSARPIRLASGKANEIPTPAIDDNSYALAVYGIPKTITSDDIPEFSFDVKKRAVLKRDGKKEIRPADVQIVLHDDTMVVVYLFPKSIEITKKDTRIEFDATVGQFKFSASFAPPEMVFEGRPEF